MLRTDADGRYRTRRRFPAHAAYYAEAAAPGRLAARSPAVAVARESDKPAVLVLRRVRTVEGRVVDRQGQPVAGAVVRQSGDGPMPTETLTAADGRFQLPGVIEGPALIFAEKPGFRFGFRPVDDGSQPAEVVLARTGEPPAVAYQTLPPALPVEEEKALARRLIAPSRREDLPAWQGRWRSSASCATRPPSTRSPCSSGWSRSSSPMPIYLELRAASTWPRPWPARTWTKRPPCSRPAIPRTSAPGLSGDLRRPRDLRPDQARELLAQAAVNAKSMKSPTYRIPVEARIADHWLDLGETERARALLDEALALGRDTARGSRTAATTSARSRRSWRGSTCRPR